MEDQKKNAALESSKSEEDVLEDEIDRVLEGMPQEARNKFREVFSMTTVMQRTSPQAELMRKLTSENIHDFIQAQDASDERRFKDRQSNRWFLLAALFLGLVGIIAVIVLLKTAPDLLEKIISPIITFVAGAIGGYGVGFKKGSSED